jgi:hypothetical protein
MVNTSLFEDQTWFIECLCWLKSWPSIPTKYIKRGCLVGQPRLLFVDLIISQHSSERNRRSGSQCFLR